MLGLLCLFCDSPVLCKIHTNNTKVVIINENFKSDTGIFFKYVKIFSFFCTHIKINKTNNLRSGEMSKNICFTIKLTDFAMEYYHIIDLLSDIFTMSFPK